MADKQWDVMLDLETLGCRPDAAIIQVGAVMFEPRSGGRILNSKGFNKHVLYQDGIGTVDHGTIGFWLTEASAAKMGKELQDKAENLGAVLQALVGWPGTVEEGLTWEGVGNVWGNPSDFDLPIIKSAFVRVGRDVPWDRRQTADARTLWKLTGGRPEIDHTGMARHDAFDDAVGQAMEVQAAMALFEVK